MPGVNAAGEFPAGDSAGNASLTFENLLTATYDVKTAINVYHFKKVVEGPKEVLASTLTGNPKSKSRIVVVGDSASLESLEFTISHELGHCFGLDDVENVFGIGGNLNNTRNIEGAALAKFRLLMKSNKGKLRSANGGWLPEKDAEKVRVAAMAHPAKSGNE